LDRRKCDEGGRPRQRSSPLPRPLAAEEGLVTGRS
jgi:hypothetical protein